MCRFNIAVVAVLAGFSYAAFSQEPPKTPSANPSAVPKDALTIRAEADAKRKPTDDMLRGLGFGMGVGALFDLGGSPRVKSATVDQGGIVRVDKGDEVRVGGILETHYLFGLDNRLNTDESDSKRVLFWGPQVSVLLGEDVISGIGGGLMLALKRRNEDVNNFLMKSFNLGVGVMVEPSVQTLGSGLHDNRKLPTGDQLRYKDKVQTGIYAMFSIGF